MRLEPSQGTTHDEETRPPLACALCEAVIMVGDPNPPLPLGFRGVFSFGILVCGLDSCINCLPYRRYKIAKFVSDGFIAFWIQQRKGLIKAHDLPYELKVEWHLFNRQYQLLVSGRSLLDKSKHLHQMLIVLALLIGGVNDDRELVTVP
ncbi:hypothetical protein PUN4_550232 [Paraburkholderia unamae]|nr:hypothetical protein PUN4_550232 [Paraburkholderia unamae]